MTLSCRGVLQYAPTDDDIMYSITVFNMEALQ